MTQYVGKIEFPCTVQLGRGLEGAITNETAIGYVDGEAGRLVYRGYDIEDLAEHSTFEETTYLLLYGDLPTRDQLEAFDRQLKQARAVPPEVLEVLTRLGRDAHPMTLLQAGISATASFDPDTDAIMDHLADPKGAVEVEQRVGIRLIARLATLVAAIERIQTGRPPLAPRDDLPHAANFLYMMRGEAPDELSARVLDMALILHADHGMNASTFTAMVVHSSLSDMYSTVAAAVGSLKGPLHGGANERALAELMTIPEPSQAEAFVAEKIRRKEKIIGFGHRVYKAYDPRARVFHDYARRLCEQRGETKLFATAEAVEKAAIAALGEKGIFPNVDFYSGLVYHALGIRRVLFTPIFAVSRVAGWVARVLEYLPNNRIFRPRAVYLGPTDRQWVPIEQR